MRKDLLKYRNDLSKDIDQLNVLQRCVHGKKSTELQQIREDKKKKYKFINNLLKKL